MNFESLNYILALGTIGLQILSVAFLAVFFLQKKMPDLRGIGHFLNRWGLWIGFLLTLGGTVVSFFYSDVLGFIPCWHCWIQRVFFFPQVVLFAVALWKKERSIADYSIALSVLGVIDALYQHYIQMGGTSVLPCPASGGDCAQRFIFEFGYITFPLMAASLFAFLIVLMLFVRRR